MPNTGRDRYILYILEDKHRGLKLCRFVSLTPIGKGKPNQTGEYTKTHFPYRWEAEGTVKKEKGKG